MKIKNLLFILILFSLSSCLSISLHAIGAYGEKAETKVFENGEKTLVYIPMRHIGLKEFYADVKRNIDSLHNEGYIVFLESTRLKDSLTPEEKETAELKLRKMIGVHMTKTGYLDTINGRLMNRKFKNRRGLINQPRYSKLGADTITDRIVDIPYNEVIKAYEDKYGEIILNPCDITLEPEAKYECGKLPKNQVDDIILNHRNKYLADEIIAEKHNKIAVVYGAMHEWGLYSELKKVDTAWKRRPRIVNTAIAK